MEQVSPNPVRAAIRSQFRYAVLLAAMGVVFLVMFTMVGPARLPGLLKLFPPMSGVFLLFYARRQYRQAVSRQHGLAVEHKAVEEARLVLRRYGFGVSPNVMTRFGDMDMLVCYANKHLPVEIKSFESWDGSPRCVAALMQAGRLRSFLRAKRSYIWLPCARVGLWTRWFGTHEGATTVVYGNARQLARILRRQEG